MTTLAELDYRVSTLEDLFKEQMHPKIESMNWAIGQVYKSTEATRADIRDLYTGLEGTRVGIASLEGTVNRRTSELRHDVLTLESSVRHDIRAFREEVNRRFTESDNRIDARFKEMNAKLDEVLAAVRSGKSGA